MLPESLTPKLRLKSDSTKSPNTPNMNIIADIAITCIKENEIRFV